MFQLDGRKWKKIQYRIPKEHVIIYVKKRVDSQNELSVTPLETAAVQGSAPFT